MTPEKKDSFTTAQFAYWAKLLKSNNGIPVVLVAVDVTKQTNNIFLLGAGQYTPQRLEKLFRDMADSLRDGMAKKITPPNVSPERN